DPGNVGRLPGSSVKAVVYGPDGDVWLGTGNGLAKWDPEGMTFKDSVPIRSVEEASVNSLCWDRSGSLWIGTLGTGLIRRAGDGKETHFSEGGGSKRAIGHDNVSVVYADEEGELFAGTQGGGLWQWRAGADGFTKLDSELPEDSAFVADIDRDANGR